VTGTSAGSGGSGASATSTATCTGGRVVLGGGGSVSSPGVLQSANPTSSTVFTATGVRPPGAGNGNFTVQAYAICGFAS
jgi:hypothetical protein